MLEFVLPRERGRKTSRRQAVVFWLLWIPCTVTTFVVLSLLFQAVGWRSTLAWRLSDLLAQLGPARLVVAPLLGAVIGDFFFYWFHRAQHAFFWPLHAVHHSIEDLNAVNSYHHATEEFMRILLMTLPMSWLGMEVGQSLPLVATLLALQPIYLHSPTRLQFGRWRAVVADNHFHRIHHSLGPRHFDKNFGACTTLWDRLFHRLLPQARRVAGHRHRRCSGAELGALLARAAAEGA